MNNKIHPTAVIEGEVRLGSRNTIGPNAVLIGPIEIGDNNQIGPGVIIGTPAQNTRDRYEDKNHLPVVIGNDCIIREYTVIHRPSYREVTRIGDRVFVMHGVHIAHDCVLENDAVITPLVALAGVVTVCEGANIALGACVQQYSVIGGFSIVAMGAMVLKSVKPFVKFVPGKPPSVNTYALKKFGFLEFEREIEAYVVDDVFPENSPIVDVVRRYELHLKAAEASV